MLVAYELDIGAERSPKPPSCPGPATVAFSCTEIPPDYYGSSTILNTGGLFDPTEKRIISAWAGGQSQGLKGSTIECNAPGCKVG